MQWQWCQPCHDWPKINVFSQSFLFCSNLLLSQNMLKSMFWLSSKLEQKRKDWENTLIFGQSWQGWHHCHCMYLFLQTLKSHLPYINVVDQQTITPKKAVIEWQDYNPGRKRKVINDSSQRGHNIYKWNFHNFQTPEFCPVLKKIKKLPFWTLRDCMVSFVSI